jgi:hypothetical protein
VKKFLSIALLSFFLLHLAGFYVYFGIRQAHIHREMRSKLKYLPADQLEVIHLSPNAYQHSLRDNGDEIEVNGKMFDIARVEVKQGQVIIYCLHDSAEDNLLSFLDHVLKNATQDRQQIPAPLFQFSALTFVLPSAFSFKNFSPFECCGFTSYTISEFSFSPSLDTPPPRD